MKSCIVITAHFITECWEMQGLTVAFQAANELSANTNKVVQQLRCPLPTSSST